MSGVNPARSGDRVSGVGSDPCHDGGGPAGSAAPVLAALPLSAAEKFAYGRQLPPEPIDAERYVRMLRPFPVRRLSEVLYHVQAEGDAVRAILNNVQIEWPQSVDAWTEALFYLLDCLDGLAERAIEVRPMIERMIDQADADAERAAVALRALRAIPPAPCPTCGGHGGSAGDGQCESCQGTAIDPDDPASPL
jgi:hypothetical protein